MLDVGTKKKKKLTKRTKRKKKIKKRKKKKIKSTLIIQTLSLIDLLYFI